MRFVDIMLCIPGFFLILAVIAFLGPNIFNIMIIIGLLVVSPLGDILVTQRNEL